jgi:hypothetical protein
MVRALPGGPVHNTVEIISYTCNEITFTSTNGPTFFQYTYRLKPTADGTRLTLDGEISAKSLSGPITYLGGLANQLFKQGMKKNLQVLKRILKHRSTAVARRPLSAITAVVIGGTLLTGAVGSVVSSLVGVFLLQLT